MSPDSRKCHVGGSISDYRNQIISSGKCIFTSSGCFPAWGDSASNYSSRSVSKPLPSQTCEQHPWKNECFMNKSLCTHLKCCILKVEYLSDFGLNLWVNGYSEVAVSVHLWAMHALLFILTIPGWPGGRYKKCHLDIDIIFHFFKSKLEFEFQKLKWQLMVSSSFLHGSASEDTALCLEIIFG